MIGREEQAALLKNILALEKSSFVAITGRRRVGKTFLVDEVYKNDFCLRVTGIQNGNQKEQILNFTQKLAEYSLLPIVTPPRNWQEAFLLLKKYLEGLSRKKKQVIFLDELPWMATARSNFIQMLAHLWNDFLSKESHFVLVICGSSTSWIAKKIVNDKGGFHNRLSHVIPVKPFNLKETKSFFENKNIRLTNGAIAELFMVMGGIPFYLDDVHRGESVATTIDRMCFMDGGLLKNEYENLYKAIFENAVLHEALVKALAVSKSGLTRTEIINKSGIEEGGPYTRTMDELLKSGFVSEETPFGKKKQGSIYRLTDEYSLFYNKFIHSNKKAGKGYWSTVFASQTYKIWCGYAFEALCFRHIEQIKKALGISGVYIETSSYRHIGSKQSEGFQIDLLLDRKDKTVNLCECKYYDGPLTITKDYAQTLLNRKSLFKQATGSRKTIFNTMLTNFPIKTGDYASSAVDNNITLDMLFE